MNCSIDAADRATHLKIVVVVFFARQHFWSPRSWFTS
jgi:hypothetical protein